MSELKLLKPGSGPNEYVVQHASSGGISETIRGLPVGDYPSEHEKSQVFQGNFLKDRVDDLVVSGEVPYGAIIGFVYERGPYSRGNKEYFLVRFIKKMSN